MFLMYEQFNEFLYYSNVPFENLKIDFITNSNLKFILQLAVSDTHFFACKN